MPFVSGRLITRRRILVLTSTYGRRSSSALAFTALGLVVPSRLSGTFVVLKPTRPAAGDRAFSLKVVYLDLQEPPTAHLAWAVLLLLALRPPRGRRNRVLR